VARRIQFLPPEYKPTVRHRTAEDRRAALCRELEYLRSEIKRLKGLIAFKDEALLDQARFLEEVLANNKRQSIEGLKRRISRVKGAADREQGGLPK
jgi:hypothetical protein